MTTRVSSGMQSSVRSLNAQAFDRPSGLNSGDARPFSNDISMRRSGRAAAVPFSVDRSQQSRSRLGANDTHRGQLTPRDRSHPDRRDRRVDLWALGALPVGQTVEISLRSRAFDPMLEVVDRRHNRVVTLNDDQARGDRNSFVSFTVERGMSYQVRVTSFDTDARGRYTLKVDAEEPTKTPFDFQAGYGLINAAAAVAAALKTNPFGNLPNSNDLWGLDAIGAPEVWAQGITGEGVTVAVLDTGVNYRHKDLRSNIWTNVDEVAGNGIDDDKNGYVDDVRGWKFVDDNTNDPDDTDGHGTHIAGTIAALNNGFGVTGIAHNAKIMPIKVLRGVPLDPSNEPPIRQGDRALAEGIRYAVDNGAKVLNISLGVLARNPLMPETRQALKYAFNAGAVAVMAAGNDGRKRWVDQPIEPAFYAKDGLGIAVGAISANRKIADFSNPAGNTPLPFVVGPGVGVKSTVLEDGYDSYSGTSMATPHVAGVVALMLSANPNLTPDQVRKILIETSDLSALTTA